MSDENASVSEGAPTAVWTPAELAERTSAHLEWRVLLDRMALECATGAGRERVCALRPLASFETAEQRLGVCREALEAADEDSLIPRVVLPDVAAILERTRRGGLASGTELRAVTTMLERSRALRHYARAARERRPKLAAVLDSEPALDRLEAELTSAIGPDGSVADAASSELARARRQTSETRRSLTGAMSQLASRYAEVLRDRAYVERDGRYTLPVRADAHLRVPGIVLGSSASGGTLYVEPQEAVELGNRLQLAEARVEREVARVLAELSGHLESAADALDRAHEACIDADVLRAIVHFARAADARVPTLCPQPRLSLRRMRHPLLVAGRAQVVPNDIELGPGIALILSGPNAGGKTVLLKCMGLAVWMAESGLPVPADEGSVVGWFDPVLSDVGDAQSIGQSLSTFSAHVSLLAQFVASAGPRTLVLLDEVAAGTDPDEGSALAAALLEELVARGAAVAATTHYERLKELASRTEGFVNASVGFDVATLTPNFKLVIGTPGPSTALAVAGRFGVPEHVVEHARALLGRPAIAREQLIEQLALEREALARARSEAEQELQEQRRLTAGLQANVTQAREKERRKLAGEASVLTDEVRDARAELRRARDLLRTQETTRGMLSEAQRAIDSAASHVAIGSRIDQRVRPRDTGRVDRPPTEAELLPGARVRLTALGAVGTVTEAPHRGQVRVQVGSVKLLSSLPELRLVDAPTSPEPRPSPRRRTSDRAHAELRSAPDTLRTSDNTLDVRGMRADEALDELDVFVDSLLRSNERYGFVLHGHGTGALKLAVRRHLASMKLVARSRAAEPDEGGDAFSVFWFEGADD
ncbi:MAG: Smr/MutS family protein [Polyangiaceae bacterium]|nr:Smr/MutS family protein [Polyangiaceae bacterium]